MIKKTSISFVLKFLILWLYIIIFLLGALMLRLHLPRASYDLLVYNFPYGFQVSYA